MTVRKALLVWFVVLSVIGGVIFWRMYGIKNQTKKILTTIEEPNKDDGNFNKEIADLIKDLDKMIAEADVMITKPQHLPKPTNGVNTSYHDEKNGKKNHENAWIDDIDEEKGIVLVRTIDSKISIIFKPTSENLVRFHKGSIAPVTFQCTKIKKGKCDFKAPYKLFVSNGLVEVKQLILPKK